MGIRRVRTYLEQHKLDQKINLLWFFSGLALLPVIAGIFGLLQLVKDEWLCGLVITLAILFIILLIAHIFLLDRFKVVNKYLSDQRVTWREVEDAVEHSEAFDEAVDEIERKKGL